MRRSALCALLPAVENARQDFLETLGLQEAVLDVVSHDAVEFIHRDGSALAAGLALAGLGRASVIPIASSLPGPQRHRHAATGTEANASEQRRAAGDTRSSERRAACL